MMLTRTAIALASTRSHLLAAALAALAGSFAPSARAEEPSPELDDDSFKPPPPRYLVPDVMRDRRPAPKLRPQLEPDTGRDIVIGFSALAFAAGSLVLGGWYVDQSGKACPDQPDAPGGCQVAWFPFVSYLGAMSILPSVPRFALGDSGGWIWSGAIAGCVVLGKVADLASRYQIGPSGVVFGYLVATALGIVDLSLTPHREDLVRRDSPRSPKIVAITPTTLSDARGTHGATLTIAGVF